MKDRYTSVEEQNAVVDELLSALAERDARIAELERASAELQSAQKAVQLAAKVTLASLRVHALLLLRPKLGVLRQYAPRPIRLPRKHLVTGSPQASLKISVVTPSLNQAAYLERTMRSVIEQNYSNLEYIVQDGGSRDGSADIIRKYASSLTRWESAKDTGQAQAINRGLQHSNGEIMAYLNSDDFFLPGALAYVAEYFSRYPDVDAVYGHRIVVDENDREVGRWVLPPHDDEVLSWVDYLPQESFFWRRSIWERVGGRMDESFQFAIDWDLILRFRDAGAKFVRLPRFLAAFRVHPEQKTSAQMEDIGLREVDRLRRRCHGRAVSHVEAMNAAAPYLFRHILCDRLMRLRGMVDTLVHRSSRVC